MVLVVCLVQAKLGSDDLQSTSTQGRTVSMTCLEFLLHLHMAITFVLVVFFTPTADRSPRKES